MEETMQEWSFKIVYFFLISRWILHEWVESRRCWRWWRWTGQSSRYWSWFVGTQKENGTFPMKSYVKSSRHSSTIERQTTWNIWIISTNNTPEFNEKTIQLPFFREIWFHHTSSYPAFNHKFHLWFRIPPPIIIISNRLFFTIHSDWFYILPTLWGNNDVILHKHTHFLFDFFSFFCVNKV